MDKAALFGPLWHASVHCVSMCLWKEEEDKKEEKQEEEERRKNME